MKKIADNDNPVSLFIPNYRATDIRDIDFNKLAKEGITNVAIDIDGTLVAAGSLKVAVAEYIDHIVAAQRAGKIERVVIATNRLPIIAKIAYRWFGVDDVVTGSLFTRKPSQKYYNKLLAALDVEPDKSVMIGDRLWQDIYGANRAGMWTILVDDLGKEPWYDRIRLHRWRQRRRLAALEQIPKSKQ